MCGITGLIDFTKSTPKKSLESDLNRMTNSLTHRGPDDCGIWSSLEYGVGLGHRRLSIIDTSNHGRQPMISNSGRFVIVYNGEIYNHHQIRTSLTKNYEFKSNSDTEVLLASIEHYGIEKTLNTINGMFAFAAWDNKDKKLTIARDRVGIKPLYFGWLSPNLLAFGSELKSLTRHSAFKNKIDKASLQQFLEYGYVSAPHSIYDAVFKLMPGTYIEIDTNKKPKDGIISKKYWSLRKIKESAQEKPLEGSEAEIILKLEDILKSSVKKRMIADVPLGAFLSGGIDSSLVVSLMQSQSNKPIKTFSIGFSENKFNEAEHAKKVANHLGTDHTEFYVSMQDALNVIPELPNMFDEPFGDSSQIPTFLVSKLAKQHVTVALSGDGGDELFGGYTRYQWANKIYDLSSWVPSKIRFSIPHIAKLITKNDRALKLAQLLPYKNKTELYENLLKQIVLPKKQKILKDNIRQNQHNIEVIYPTDMQFHDFINYLPNDILTKVDRASMHASLEARVPLLDHNVVEYVWRMPYQTRFKNFGNKDPLRQILYKHVPKNIIDRPKMGFGVPIAEWLRKDLNSWASDLLSSDNIKKNDLLNYDLINKYWLEHQSGKRNWSAFLWNVLMFQSWQK